MQKSKDTDVAKWRATLPTTFITVSDWEALVVQTYPEYGAWPKGVLSQRLHSETNHKITQEIAEIIRKGEKGNSEKLIRRKQAVVQEAIRPITRITLDLPDWVIEKLRGEADKFGMSLDNKLKSILGEFASKI